MGLNKCTPGCVHNCQKKSSSFIKEGTRRLAHSLAGTTGTGRLRKYLCTFPIRFQRQSSDLRRTCKKGKTSGKEYIVPRVLENADFGAFIVRRLIPF